jgi:small-conductance mechanosensitive channel
MMLDEIKEIWGFVLATTPDGSAVTIGQIVSVILLVVVGYLGSRLIGYLLGRRLSSTSLRPDIIYILQRIAFFVLIVFVAMTALSLLGIPLTAFAFATGAIAIGVGFGAQNIINNFISGWILMAERPIRIGDGVHLLVPNSQLLERTVVNWTLIDREVRTTVRVGVAYGSPVVKVAELIMQAVKEQPETKAQPHPSVVFEDFGDSALVFDAYFWCDVGGEKFLREIRSAIRFRITELFEESGITIAFPQRDVHLDVRHPLEVRVTPGA